LQPCSNLLETTTTSLVSVSNVLETTKKDLADLKVTVSNFNQTDTYDIFRVNNQLYVGTVDSVPGGIQFTTNASNGFFLRFLLEKSFDD
jgi:hypothetical protein